MWWKRLFYAPNKCPIILPNHLTVSSINLGINLPTTCSSMPMCSTKNQLYFSFTLSISVSDGNNIFYTYFQFYCILEVHFCVSPKGMTTNKAPEGGMMAPLRRGLGHDNNNTANRTFNRWCHLLHNQLLMFFASACACLQEMMDYCTIFLFFRLPNDAA